MKKTIQLIIFIGILVTASLGCGIANDLFPPTSAPTFPAPDLQPTSTSQDSVEIAPSEQPSLTSSYFVEGSLAYDENGFRITVNRPRYLLWSTAGKDYQDIQLEVIASLTEGGEDNTFGLICRYQDPDNFYALVISSDGYYAIRKRFQGGALDPINLGGYQYSANILAGQVNRLQAECNGNTLRLFVNGSLLAEVTDSDLVHGDVGLIAGTFTAETTNINFYEFLANPGD